MNRPYDFDKMLKRYNEIKEFPDDVKGTLDLAIIAIVEFQLAIEKGNKHFHPKTGKELTTVIEIINCLIHFKSINVSIPTEFIEKEKKL